MKKLLPTFIFLLVTGLAVAFVYKDKIFPPEPGERAEQGSRGSGSGRRGRRGGGDPNRPVSVLAGEAVSKDVPVYLYGVGTVQAFNTATVRAQVSGRLTSVNYAEGQDVKRGDVLAQIDPVTYKAALDQAAAKKGIDEALLGNARRDLQRYEGLAKSDYGTRQQADTQRALVEQYEAQIRQDQAAIDSAKADLDFATVRAPIDGRTGIRQVDVGNLVSSTDTGGIVVITQLQPISVLFTLPERYVSELIGAKSRGPVALVASAGGETLAEGSLEVIDNQIEEATGTVRMKGTFSNTPLKLWPGQFVNIRLHLNTLQGATVVSSAAVQQGAAGRYVYLAQPDNTVKLTVVEVKQEDEREAVIAAGLRPGDKVVTSGFASLQDGAKITLDGAGEEQTPAAEGTPQADGRGERGEGRRRGDWPQSGGAAERLPPASGETSPNQTGRRQ